MLSYMIPVDTAEKPPAGPPRGPTPPTTAGAPLNLNLTTATLTNGNTAALPTSAHHHLHRSCLVTTTTSTSSNMPSKDSSVNSFASDVTTGSSTGSGGGAAATPTIKMVTVVTAASNGGPPHHHQVIGATAAAKHHSLKRVSFGSSKGSMVETLIYESPLQEEPEPSPIPENGTPFPEDGEQTEDERERVRVSFVQHSKPQEVQLPDEPVILSESEFMMAAAAIAESNHVITTYTRQESTESGWDNPFRPGGDLSREADEIVELIKGGKPITPTSGTAPSDATALSTVDGSTVNSKSPVHESPANKKAAAAVATAAAAATNPQTKNGSGTTNATANNATAKNGGTNAAAVNVQRGNVGGGQPAGEVEHVVLKKEKSKCKCCVVQ